MCGLVSNVLTSPLIVLMIRISGFNYIIPVFSIVLSIPHRKIVSKRRTTINHRGWIQNMASNSVIQASSSGSVSAMSDTAVRALPASLACEQSIQTVIEVASSAHAAFATHVETIIKTIHLMTRAEAAPSLVPATTANALVGLPTIHVSPPLHTIGSYPESRKTNRINGPLVWIICFIMAGLIVIGVLIWVLIRLLRHRQPLPQGQRASRLRNPEQWIDLTHVLPARTRPRNNQSWS